MKAIVIVEVLVRGAAEIETDDTGTLLDIKSVQAERTPIHGNILVLSASPDIEAAKREVEKLDANKVIARVASDVVQQAHLNLGKASEFEVAGLVKQNMPGASA